MGGVDKILAASALPALGPTAVRFVAFGDVLIPGTKVPGFYLKALCDSSGFLEILCCFESRVSKARPGAPGFVPRLVFWKLILLAIPAPAKPQVLRLRTLHVLRSG